MTVADSVSTVHNEKPPGTWKVRERLVTVNPASRYAKNSVLTAAHFAYRLPQRKRYA